MNVILSKINWDDWQTIVSSGAALLAIPPLAAWTKATIKEAAGGKPLAGKDIGLGLFFYVAWVAAVVFVLSSLFRK